MPSKNLLLVASATALVPVAASASETINFGYDAKGRLVSVAHAGTVNGGLTATYVFDPADNRTDVAVSGATASPPPTSPPDSPPVQSGRIVVVPLNGLTVIPLPSS